MEKHVMRIVLSVVLMWWCCTGGDTNVSRYTFYRDMGGRIDYEMNGAEETVWGEEGGGRRVFGGEATELSSFRSVCALLDRYWRTRCSASVVAPHWALTAAHCITPRVAYVKYNTRRPASPEGDVTAVNILYRHPKYKVMQVDEGRGADVTILHHDLGLVRTRDEMVLATALPFETLYSLRRYNLYDLKNEEVQVLGFGSTENSVLGEELFEVRLKLVVCGRNNWVHCVCGTGTGRVGTRGVCSGDSGGPVVYRGTQVAVTSMGPLECLTRSEPPATATSVFTSLYQYVDLLNTTVTDMEHELGMQKISSATRQTLNYIITFTAITSFIIFIIFE